LLNLFISAHYSLAHHNLCKLNQFSPTNISFRHGWHDAIVSCVVAYTRNCSLDLSIVYGFKWTSYPCNRGMVFVVVVIQIPFQSLMTSFKPNYLAPFSYSPIWTWKGTCTCIHVFFDVHVLCSKIKFEIDIIMLNYWNDMGTYDGS
jgi:hypothetical protein